MANKVTKIGVLTSGGDAPGMNAAIRAVVRACSFYKLECIGIQEGYDGLINNKLVPLDARSVRNIVNKGGTFLKTARSEEFKTVEGRKKAYDNLTASGVDSLVVIGGDGSFTGAMKLAEEFDFPVIGIPGTIDNDINGTDYTIGYDTALNTVVEAIDKIRDTASSHNRLFFIEVMGRDAGDIALNAGIGAGAEEILIPEEDLGVERLLESLQRSRKSGKSSSIIVVAEGDRLGENIFELSEYVKNHTEGYDIRVSVLGHIQRGGAPSCFDRVLASKLGVGAVESLIKGKRDVMIGIVHKRVTLVPLQVALTKRLHKHDDLIRVADITST